MASNPATILQEARHLLQLNQADFAKRFGKTQTTLSRYESGKVQPPTDVVMHCMHILNVDNASDEIEQIIIKIKALDGEEHKKFREAISVLLNSCVFN